MTVIMTVEPALCDRCGAKAKWLWTLDESKLFFCGHHSNKHDSKLIDKNWIPHEME